ncbi:MAG: hypothetical protein JO130_11295 [Solirubrobacterales bacterium]|nr:hypothetical protein [Solirubrobacterales bacterium]
MNAPHEDGSPKGLRGWWTSPPRTGMRLIIAPWEYRRLRAFATARIFGATLLASLGFVTLGFGGSDTKTYGWAFAFFAGAAAHFAFACWELSIARSQTAGS